jgi:hypothetical protein
MMIHFNEIVLGLFVINLAMAFGAGLYESRIVIPMWFTRSGINKEAIINTDTGRKFWGMVTTVPLTLLTLINIVEAMGSRGTLGILWMTAGIVVLIERVMTFSYFIPTIIKLMKPGSIPQAQALIIASRWTRVNTIRISLNLAGLVISMIAYTLLVSSIK